MLFIFINDFDTTCGNCFPCEFIPNNGSIANHNGTANFDKIDSGCP